MVGGKNRTFLFNVTQGYSVYVPLCASCGMVCTAKHYSAHTHTCADSHTHTHTHTPHTRPFSRLPVSPAEPCTHSLTHLAVFLEVGVAYPQHSGVLPPANVYQSLHDGMPSGVRFV